MAANPFNNVTALIAVASPTGPYEPQAPSFTAFVWNVVVVPGVGTSSNNLVTGTIPAAINVPVGTTGVFFTDLINGGTVSQTVTVAPTTLSSLPVTLLVCQLDPSTNGCLSAPSSSLTATAAPNDAVGAFATFVTATSAIPYNPVNNVAYLTFADSSGTVQAAGFANVNTETNVAALQVVAATSSNNDVLTIPFSTQGTGAFAVEVANFGAPDDAGVALSWGNLPLNVTICQTNPSNGQCLAPPVAGFTGLSVPLATGTSATFSVFVTATAAIASDPGNRIYITVTNDADTGGGLASVAVVTQ